MKYISSAINEFFKSIQLLVQFIFIFYFFSYDLTKLSDWIKAIYSIAQWALFVDY
jgi:hypothetical protein